MTYSGKTILLAGGNGYIGCTTAFALKEAGFNPVILDDFSTSKSEAQRTFKVHEVDLTDISKARALLKSLGPVESIVHFAARALVPESFQAPGLYYRNNLITTANLAELAVELGISTFVHSSSCAVYGTPEQIPIRETSPLKASSPYGDSKIMAEMILNRFQQMGNLRVLNLRYFNPAGAWSKYGWGEAHDPETHLIPNVLIAALKDLPVSVFGSNYETPDGTCIRDFIHVVDLAEAHVKAIQALQNRESVPLCLNVGTGQGFSVLEVIRMAEKVTGKKIKISFKPPRPGDPPHLVADNQQMVDFLGWRPSRSLQNMIEDDWTWRTSNIK